LSPRRPWADYAVTSRASGRSYRVALRGHERGESYCSCPDFRKNTLGTCKHILCVLARVRRRFRAAELARPYLRRTPSLCLRYDEEVSLRLALPAHKLAANVARTLEPLRERAIENLRDCVRRVRKLERLGTEVTVYPDAEAFTEEGLLREHLQAVARAVRADPGNHPLRRELLRAELLPDQLDGIAFAAGAGRAVLADDVDLARRSRPSGWPSCCGARSASAASWSSVPPR
jgi:hypothetical protein